MLVCLKWVSSGASGDWECLAVECGTSMAWYGQQATTCRTWSLTTGDVWDWNAADTAVLCLQTLGTSCHTKLYALSQNCKITRLQPYHSREKVEDFIGSLAAVLLAELLNIWNKNDKNTDAIEQKLNSKTSERCNYSCATSAAKRQRIATSIIFNRYKIYNVKV